MRIDPGAPGRRTFLQMLIAGGIGIERLFTPRLQAAAAFAEPHRPFPHRQSYAAGAIRPNHRSEREQEDDVRAAYGRWKARYLVEVRADAGGGRLFRVAFGKPATENHAITVSEGQGFGMVIVAHMAGHDPEAQIELDGLWRFAQANPSGIDRRLMNWHVPAKDEADSAFDGDCDMAYALLLADAQWGSAGVIDYRAAAIALLGAMAESTIGPVSRYPLLGD